MNIWICNNHAMPPVYGGLARHYYFAKNLQEKGHRFRIITDSQIHNTPNNMVERGELMRDVDFDGVRFTFVRGMSYRKNDYRRILNGLQFNHNLGKAMEALYESGDKPDVIYGSSPAPFTPRAALSFAKAHQIPFIFEERDLWPLSLVQYGELEKKRWSAPFFAALYRLEHRLHREADASIFTIAGGKDYLRDRGWTDVDPNRVYYINNGVDLAEYEANLAQVTYEDEDLDDPLTYKIVYTGSIRMIYEIDRILDLAKKVAPLHPKVRFFFYGEGPERPRLEERVKNEGIGNVFFKGRVQKAQIPAILARADLALKHHKKVGLNQYGSSNNKVFEYLASGTPIFSTVWNNHSVIRSYDAGLECKDQSLSTMLAGLETCLSWDEAERARLQANAKKAAQQFDFKILSDRLEQILWTLVE